MATEPEELSLSSQNTMSQVSSPKRSSVLESLRKHPSVQNWLHPHERAGLCRDCYNQLYESFPLKTWLTDHGTFADVERNAENKTCSVCNLIVTTMKEDKRRYAEVIKTHKFRIMHLGRFFNKSTMVAGGSFFELRVTVDNVEVCQLLVTRAIDASKFSFFERPSQIEDIGADDLSMIHQNIAIGDPEQDYDLEHIDSMTLESVSDASDLAERWSIADSVADTIPETILESTPEPTPERTQDSTTESIADEVADPSPETSTESISESIGESAPNHAQESNFEPSPALTDKPAKKSRRNKWRKSLDSVRSRRWSNRSDKELPPTAEDPISADDPDARDGPNRVEPLATGPISDVGGMPPPTRRSTRTMLREKFREKAWKRELLNLKDYRSNWFETIEERRQLNFETVKFWISNCQARHKDESTDTTDAKFIDIILVDVQDGCLIHADTGKRYLSLSYQWGKDPDSDSFTLKKDNFHIFQEEGSLFRSDIGLPETFSDAMTLVRNIGERYLWIDRLCIKQDDQEHFDTNVDRMDLIFGKSIATIIKMTGASAWDPLPGIRPFSRPPLCNVLKTQDRVVVCRHPSLGTLAHDCSYETR